MPSDFKYTGLAAQEAPTNVADLMAWKQERSRQEVAYRNAQSDASKASEASQNALLADQQAQKQGFKNAQDMQDYERRNLDASRSRSSYTEEKSYTTGGVVSAGTPLYPEAPPSANPVLQNPTYYPDMRSNREFQAQPTVVPNPGDPYGISFRSNAATYKVPPNTYDSLSGGHGVTNSAQSSKIAQGQISAMMNTLPQSFTGSETFQTFRQNMQYFTDRNLLTPEQVTDILTAVQNNAPMGILQGGDWVNQLNDYVTKNGALPSNFKSDGQSLASLMCQKFTPGTLTGIIYAIAADADITQDRRQNILQSLSSEYGALADDTLKRSGYSKIVVGGVPLYIDLTKNLSVDDKLKQQATVGNYLAAKKVDQTQRVQYSAAQLGTSEDYNVGMVGLLIAVPHPIYTSIPPDVSKNSGMFQDALDKVNETLKNQPLTQWQTGTSEFLTGGVQQHGNIVDVVEHAVLNDSSMTAFASRNTDHPGNYGLDHPGAHVLQTGYDLFESASSVTEGNAVSGFLEKAATAASKETGVIAETLGLGAAESAGEALGLLGGVAEVAGVAAAVVGIAEGINELLVAFGVVNENYVSEEVSKLWNDAKGLL